MSFASVGQIKIAFDENEDDEMMKWRWNMYNGQCRRTLIKKKKNTM